MPHDDPNPTGAPPPEQPGAARPPTADIARTAELAALLAGGPPRRRPRGPGARVALAVGALALVVVGALALTARLRRPAGGDGEGPGTLLRPLEAARDPASGEVTAPFSGFAVSIETVPPGAVVTVDGVARGEAPVFAGVDCRPGDRVEVRAERPGRPAARADVACRADTLVKLTLRLGR